HHGSADHEFECTDAPFEDADFQAPAVPGKPRKEVPEPGWVLAFPCLLPPASTVREMDARIEIPTDQHNPPPGLQHRLLHQVEISFRIDDHAYASRHRIAPNARFDGVVAIGHR